MNFFMIVMELRSDRLLHIFIKILEYIWRPLQSSFLFMGMGALERGGLSKVICVVKPKVIQPQPKYKSRNL